MGTFDDISLTPEDFGARVSTHTLLTGPQLQELFPSRAERNTFLELLELLHAHTSENDKQREFVHHAGRFAAVALKVMRKTVMGL